MKGMFEDYRVTYIVKSLQIFNEIHIYKQQVKDTVSVKECELHSSAQISVHFYLFFFLDDECLS